MPCRMIAWRRSSERVRLPDWDDPCSIGLRPSRPLLLIPHGCDQGRFRLSWRPGMRPGLRHTRLRGASMNLLLALPAMLLTAPAAPVESDLDRLQGTWVLVEMRREGE